MKTLTVKRVCTGLQGTFGVLIIDGYPAFLTLEDPDNNNEPQKSCIPTGNYLAERDWSERFQRHHFFIRDVPGGRSGVIFGHSGNTHHHTTGCVLLGQMYGSIAEIPAILNSRVAVNRFESRITGPFRVEFVRAY